jgi:hypothetical protein
MTVLAIAPPEAEQQLTHEGGNLIAAAEALQVTNDAEEQAAFDFRNSIKNSSATVVEYFSKMKSDAHKAWKTICGKENAELEPRTRAEQIINRKLSAYRAEKEQRALEERRQREEAARKLAEDQQLAEAAAAEAAGDHQTAEEIISAPIRVAPPEVAISKPVGGSYRGVWNFEITSLQQLVTYIAANPALLNLLKPNETAIRSLVIAQKDGFNIPGVRAWETKSPATARR